MADARDILVDSALDAKQDEERLTPSQELVGWVMKNVPRWRNVRDSAYKQKWDDYYRTWRGKWSPDQKTRKSERSRLISPLTLMAVDLTVAEIVEAIFGRELFFDLADDIADQDKKDATAARDALLEDLYRDGVVAALVEVVLNGALYGTGIAKIAIDVEKVSSPRKVPVKYMDEETGEESTREELKKVTEEKVKIFPVSVEPGQFVPDPAATTIEDMLGCAHEFKMPLHKVVARQRDGTYRREAVVAQSALEYSTEERAEEDQARGQADYAFITEYHGLAPKRLFVRASAEGDELAEALAEDIDEEELIEAIITIANESSLLRAIPNPSLMDDRGILAYQHDNVPNRFWGRGVPEKAFHPQKAMDAEMRSRADSLAWISNPMLAGDLTKLPPRMNLNVWPGKFWGTKGNPRETLQEFRFGDINASTFQQTQELERMGQQATGALDSIMSIRGNVRDETATGSAISASGFLKRSKRTMFNIEGFLGELIRRILWRKMQFEPERFPRDFKFQVKGTVGIMAREIEQQFSVNLLQFAEQGSPPYLLILKDIFSKSTSSNKAEMVSAIDAMLQPPDPKVQQQQEALQQAQFQAVLEEVRNKRADTALKLAGAGLKGAQTELTRIEAEFKDDEQILANLRGLLDQEEIENQREQNAISRDKLEVERDKVRVQAAQAKRGE